MEPAMQIQSFANRTPGERSCGAAGCAGANCVRTCFVALTPSAWKMVPFGIWQDAGLHCVLLFMNWFGYVLKHVETKEMVHIYGDRRLALSGVVKWSFLIVFTHPVYFGLRDWTWWNHQDHHDSLLDVLYPIISVTYIYTYIYIVIHGGYYVYVYYHYICIQYTYNYTKSGDCLIWPSFIYILKYHIESG